MQISGMGSYGNCVTDNDSDYGNDGLALIHHFPQFSLRLTQSDSVLIQWMKQIDFLLKEKSIIVQMSYLLPQNLFS